MHITIERSFNFIVPTLIGTSTAVYVVPNHINLVKNDEYGIENHTYIMQFWAKIALCMCDFQYHIHRFLPN